jgi:hypothetical protein
MRTQSGDGGSFIFDPPNPGRSILITRGAFAPKLQKTKRAIYWRELLVIVCAISAILPIQSARAQVTIGGLAADDAVCTGPGGVLNSQYIDGFYDACDEYGGSVLTGTSNGSITATTGAGNTSINGPTIVSTTGMPAGTTTISGGDVTAGGTVSANIVSASVGNITTINSASITNTGNIETSTLNVTGASTTTGITNTGNLVNTGDIKTTTLNVTGASTTTGITNTGNLVNTGNIQTNTLQTTGNAGVGGNLAVTGTSTFTGAATFNGGATVNQSFKVGSGSTVSMGNNVVHDVAAPIVGTDAANKAYVDQGLNAAFKKIEENTEGIAIAIALGGLAVPENKTFAFGANLGFFDGKEAVSAQTAIRLDQYVTLSGGVGVGLDSSQVGGRVGLMTAW